MMYQGLGEDVNGGRAASTASASFCTAFQVAPDSATASAAGVATSAAAALLRVAAAELPAGSFSSCFLAAAATRAIHEQAFSAGNGAFGIGLDHGTGLAPRLLQHRAVEPINLPSWCGQRIKLW